MTVPKDVDSYIANASNQARPILKEIREIIKSAIPKAEEKINWGFPFYKYNDAYVHFAEYKHHVAVGFSSDLKKENLAMLEKNGYTTGQKRIQIKFDQKVPTTTIKQILKSQAK